MRLVRSLLFEIKMSRKFIILLLLSISTSVFSQDRWSPEKIYLQLASEVFATDQTIWFKAIVTDAISHRFTEISGVLHVELIGPDGKIVSRKLVKLSKGVGRGSFEPEKGLPEGRYLVQAYTQWNRNFGDDFIYKRYVDIVAPWPSNNPKLLDSLKLEKVGDGRFLLSAKVRSDAIESTGAKQVQVAIERDKGSDTLLIKRNGHGAYAFEYEMLEDPSWVTVTVEGLSETVVLDQNEVDLQFFPESGTLIEGYSNKIAYKAIGIDGKGSRVQGTVFDDRGKHIIDFVSNRLGMGYFSIYAESSRTYHAEIRSTNGPKTIVKFPLPKSASNGSIISVQRTGKNIWAGVYSNVLSGNVYIKVSCRGQDLIMIEGPLRDGYLSKSLLSEALPEGILVFTLMDQNKNTVAERLFFNEKTEDHLKVDLATDRETYARRQPTQLDILITGQDSVQGPVELSVLAINSVQGQHTFGNIKSYFLLSSELRGTIEDPDYYFNSQNTGRAQDLDALMLSQGWRRYKYPAKRIEKTLYWPQSRLEVRGSVQAPGRSKLSKEGVGLTLSSFSKSPVFYSGTTDSLGNFRFMMEDTYGPPMRVLLTVDDGKKGNKLDYRINLNNPKPPKVTYDRRPAFRQLDTLIRSVAGMERVRTEAILDSLYGVTQLDEVIVTDNLLSPERKKLYDKYGEPDGIVNGDDLRAKEKKWSYGLYSILLFNYGDQVFIEKYSDGFMLAHVRAGQYGAVRYQSGRGIVPGNPKKEGTLLIVDGKPLDKHQYGQVSNMSPEIIERVELIQYASSFRSLYQSVFPEVSPMNTPSLGHIISVVTKGGLGINTSIRPTPGTFNTSVEVFSPVMEFYTPKYDSPIPTKEQKPDLRALIHWQPHLSTDKSGSASARFYNGDVPGDYIIVVEAISRDGRVGYGKKHYVVSEK